MFILWFFAKEPSKRAATSERYDFYFKFFAAHLFFNKIGPAYHQFITWMTQYYPFSQLYESSLLHANNIKVRNLMRSMEATAANAKIPVYINNGYRDKYLSVFLGKLEGKGVNKQDALQKLQKLFQDKFGAVYIREEKIGFRVLVDTNLL